MESVPPPLPAPPAPFDSHKAFVAALVYFVLVRKPIYDVTAKPVDLKEIPA